MLLSKVSVRPLDLKISGTDKFEKYVISVHGEGDCFVHSMCMAIYKRYIDNPDLRSQFGRNIRVQISKKLDDINPHDPYHRTYYESAGNGHLYEMWKEGTLEFSKEEVRRHLASQECIGDGIIHLISGAMGKTVFYIDGGTRDIHAMPGVPNMNIPCVVIYYSGGHYETVTIKEGDELITHFNPTHPFIQALYKRTVQLKEKDYINEAEEYYSHVVA